MEAVGELLGRFKMNQRGFISSSGVYIFVGILLLGVSYGLYLQIQRNGVLTAQNETLADANKLLKEQKENADKAQVLAQSLKTKAEAESARTHIALANLRKEHEKLLSLVLPDGLIVGLLDAIDQANSDLPARKLDGPDKTPIPKINLGGLYEWATEAVPEALKKCNADKEAVRSLCPKDRSEQ